MGGDSTDPAEGTLADHVAAVVNAMDTCTGPVLLVGHSVGAGLAWAAAEARIDRVDRVARLVLVGGFPTGDGRLLADGLATSGSHLPFPGWDAFDDAEVHDLDADMRARMEAQVRPSSARVVTEPQRLRDDRRHRLPVTMVCPDFSSEDAKRWVDAGAAPVAELAALDSVQMGGPRFGSLATGLVPGPARRGDPRRGGGRASRLTPQPAAASEPAPPVRHRAGAARLTVRPLDASTWPDFARLVELDNTARCLPYEKLSFRRDRKIGKHRRVVRTVVPPPR